MSSERRPFSIDIWHNILWSQYKGEVFSSLWEMVDKSEFDLRFIQFAETDGKRVSISGVDLSRHRYPFDLVFEGCIDTVGLRQRLSAILTRTLRSEADLTVLMGYEKMECWLQLLILLLRRRKTAVFCDSTIHDQKQRFVRGLLKSAFFRVVSGIFGYGTRTKEYVVHYGANPAKVFIPCHAVALPLTYTPAIALESRMAAGISPTTPRFLYVGRLSAEKGLGTLLNAFARIRPKFPAASLIFVGDGKMRAALEKKTLELGLGGSVQFAGSKTGDELFREFTIATALVLPSTSEPWGLVVNEALSHGCPAIVSDRCGCVPELIIEGKTGMVHATDNVEDLAEKMLAAPAQFSDVETTARACLNLMAQYTPQKAANRIIAGCRAILLGMNQ